MPNIDTLFAEFDTAFEEGFPKKFRNPIIKNVPLFAQGYFNNAKITIKNNFKFINNTKASTSSYDSKLFHFAKGLGYKMTILYVNADGFNVINKYKEDTIKPKPDEIILFVEIKDNKVNTGQIVRVKLGKNVMDDLIDRWFEIDVSPKELGNFLIKEIKELQKETSNDSNVVNSKKISTSDIRKPLIKAIENEFNKTKFDDVYWLVLILKGYTFNKIDAWLTKAASELRLLKKKNEGEDEKYWNGNLPKNKYEPFFIPKALLKIDDLKQEDVEKVLNKPIQSLRELVDKKINKSLLVPRWAKDKIQSVIFNLEEQNKKYAKTIVKKLQFSLDTLKHFNAYYVGIMNGILIFIADILDLVALIVIISKQELGFKLTDELREVFENILNEVIYNTEEFKEQLDEQIMYLSINFANWFYRFENNSYFKLKQIGELVPEVLSAIISWLKVAKANKVASLTTNLTKREIKEIKEKLLKESVEEVVEKSKKEAKEKLDDLTEFIDNIGRNLDSIRLKKVELKKWIEEIRKLGGDIKHYKTSPKMTKYFDIDNPNARAAFNPNDIPPTIWIKDNVTDLEKFHESMHFEDFLRRGKRNYIRGNERKIVPLGNLNLIPKRDVLINKYIKEKYVLDKILEEQAAWIKKFGKGRFSEGEIDFSKKYFNGFKFELIKHNIDINNIKIK